MADFKVTEIVSQRLWEKDDRKVIYFDVRVEGLDKLLNLGRKPGNEVKVGETLVGDVEDDGKGKLKFTTERKFGVAGGGLTDEEKRGIRRQHSQEMALRYLAASSEGDVRPPNLLTDKQAAAEFFNGPFRGLIDAFERDIKRSVDG